MLSSLQDGLQFAQGKISGSVIACESQGDCINVVSSSMTQKREARLLPLSYHHC